MPGDRTLVESRHAFHADTPQDREAGLTELNRHGKLQMDVLKSRVENQGRLAELTLSFEDSLVIAGELKEVYQVLREVGAWPPHLPHITALDVTEDDNDVQFFELRTQAVPAPSRFVRICLPYNRVAYKQLITAPPMELHIGQWTLTETAAGIVVTHARTVVLAPLAVGEGASVADLHRQQRKTLSPDSLAELQFVKRMVETGSH